MRKRDPPRPEVGEVVGRADHVGGDVRRQRRQAERDQRHDQHDRVLEQRDQEHRVPELLLLFGRQVGVDDEGGRRDGHADEREQAHRRRQAQRLAERLVALRVGVAAEVGDVQRQRRPEADVGRQGREEEGPELARLRPAGRELRGLRQHRPEAAGPPVGPGQQRQAQHDQQRRLDVQQDADRLDALVDHQHVDRPEGQEAGQLRRR